ncbi:hypothetical protein [Nocardioides limicola]|uniref:hypothetical protein n=1 Tax=Nocardioides limicola TaxID=2803368 RepID=UPI00193B2168|nr:hypothetical protein [Nocardioides sp. DJM-14]
MRIAATARPLAVLGLLALIAAAGCGTQATALPTLDEDSAIFVGVEPSIVTEVLAHPQAQAMLDEEGTADDDSGSSGEERRDSLAQGIAINFVMCRATAEAYKSWLSSGVRPATPRVPTVAEPQEPSYSDWLDLQDRLDGLFMSGDPAQVRDRFLTGAGSCGEWIPAVPGDVSGPTIEDEIEDFG